MPASCTRQRSIYSISEYGNITPLMSRVTSWDLYSPWIRNTPVGKARISTRRFVSPSRILHLPSCRPSARSASRSPQSPPSRSSGYTSCTYLVIFALSTANKFTFANGKCHFIVRRGNDLSNFSPKDINNKSGRAQPRACVRSGPVTRPPIYAGFRKGGRIYDTKLIFGKARGVLNRRDGGFR